MAIGVGLILLGAVVMIFAQFAYPAFFKRKPEVADPGILEGTVVGEASVMADRTEEEGDERDSRRLRRIGLQQGGAGRRACEMAKALGDKVVIVFGYAPPAATAAARSPPTREAVEELGEKVTAEAAAAAEAAGVEHEVRLMAAQGRPTR